ncbi:hypothetical protein QQF64_025741 [Cirrhinus molitorella]|uniref:DDE Tnp4 domain-containing protein n=1 Tax=Cirrhinus molitorella TaxID=172907 RepID=A0ABR3NQY3_9TELE
MAALQRVLQLRVRQRERQRQRQPQDTICHEEKSGYPLRPYLFTPVANPVSNSEADFNEAHRVARSIVERTLGRWKLCFRAIHKSSGGLLFVPQKCCAVITVTAMLHNIAVWARVPLDIREEDEEEEENEDEMRSSFIFLVFKAN